MSVQIYGVAVDTPEHDKLIALNGDDDTIGQFLDWLMYDSDYQVCEWLGGEWVQTGKNTRQLLAEYFEIDMRALDAEKGVMLKALRDGQESAK